MTTPRFNADDSQLIADLHRISQKSPKLIRSSVYRAPSDPTVDIWGWKMNEYKYSDVPCPFPTLARGLFSRELDKTPGSDQPRYQIVARGYDKFFNMGEVPWTDWSSLEAHTGPNYTLSLKSNGCIIFIASISPSELIVTSKHMLGGMDGVPETHSQAGHRWLKTHLASKQKTEAQLAAVLWEKNWTAVAELCDDNFEEHVLRYPPEKAGLYLHGINETCKQFHTLPTQAIDAFAEKWGFLKTATVVHKTLAEVKEFTDEVARTGKWKGEPLEGFVIRTSIVDPKPGLASRGNRPPYPTGSSFFFKVKFDEPYMMYRDWREITKSLLSAKGSLDDASIPKSQLKRKETQAYLRWVKGEIKTNQSAFQEYTHGKGIIATRERFLRWLDSEQGKAKVTEPEQPVQAAQKFGRAIIVPVAVPGCGKTAVSVALTHLFRFGHTQSDDVQAKKPGPFIKSVVDLLKQHNVVIADKNNHLRQHRQALRDAVSRIEPPVSLLALNWTLDRPRAAILHVCGARILDRGDRHQTLRADMAGKSHEAVILQFLRDSQKLLDSEVDVNIEMDIDEPLEATVARAVDGCVKNIEGLKQPSKEQMDEAIAVAKQYVPAKKRETKNEKKQKGPASPRYFGILVELDIKAVLAPQIEQEEDVPYDGKPLWAKLVSEQRIADPPHITVVHKAELSEAADLWERCTALDRLPAPPLFSFTLNQLLWNDRVMALTVGDLGLADVPENRADLGQEKHEFVSMLPADVRRRLHITVATLHGGVPPYEAAGLVEAWRDGQRTGIGSLELEGLSAVGRIKGLGS